MIAIKHADHRVDARSPLQKFRAVALHEAARDDDTLDFAFVFTTNRVMDHFKRFIFRRFEEAASVHHNRIRRLVFVH